jgi:hypothetical protein
MPVRLSLAPRLTPVDPRLAGRRSWLSSPLSAFSTADQRRLRRRVAKLLSVPAVYLMRVWLVRADGDPSDRNRFIPIAPAPLTLDPNEVYAEPDFITRLRELALTVPEMGPDDERGGA